MGQIFNDFTVSMKNNEYIEKFVDTFNEIAGDDMASWFQIYKENFKPVEDAYQMNVEDAEFATFDSELVLRKVIIEFLNRYPQANIFVEHEKSFSNCGDTVITRWTYKDNTLTETMWAADYPSLDYCEECEWEPDDDQEAIVHMTEWDPEETYICPECGAEFDYTVDKYVSTFAIPYTEK